MCPANVLNLVAFLVVCFTYSTDADLGDSCQTPNGERSTCVSIYDCPMLLGAIRTTDVTQLRFLKESQCGYKNKPLVCCGSFDNYKSKQNNSTLPDRRSCGFQESDRIFGGEDTAMDEFPWMALIEYQRSNGQKQFSCGGALISDRYVLTAAHCLVGEILTKVGRPVSVRLGEWNTDTSEDCIVLQRRNVCSPAPLNIGIDKAISHENYDITDDNRFNDIGLIRLARKVTFSNYVRAICLPLPTESSSIGEKLYIAGWGKTLTDSRSAVKQKLLVPVAEKSQCASTFRLASIDLGNNQICAGGEKNKDSCKGDSGGPLMRTTPSDPSQWYVEGIVSFGAECGSEGWPGIYTKVSSYLQWIQRNVKN